MRVGRWIYWLSVFVAIGFAAVQSQPNESIEYKICATKKVSTFEQELNDLGRNGFRVDPTVKLSTTTALLASTKPSLAQKYEYKLIDSLTLKKHKGELLTQNFAYRATLFDTASPFALLKTYFLFEKETDSTSRAQDYGFCEPKQECLTEVQKRGDIPFALSPYFLLFSSSKEKTVPASEAKEYRLLSTMKTNTLEKELNESAQQGFRFFLNSNLSEVLMVRESNRSTPGKYEYVLAAANKEKDVEKLNELSKQGYHPLGNKVMSGYMIFEKPPNQPSIASYLEFKILATRDEKKLEADILEASRQNWQPVFMGGTSSVYEVVLSRGVATKK